MPLTASLPLALHDALPISAPRPGARSPPDGLYGPSASIESVVAATLTVGGVGHEIFRLDALQASHDVARLPYTLRILLENVLRDRKSTRLNSSHVSISYAAHREPPPCPTRRSSDLGTSSRCAIPTGRTLRAFCFNRERGRSDPDRRRRRARDLPARRAPGLPRRRAAALHAADPARERAPRSEEHTSELQSRLHLVCRSPRASPLPYTTLFRSRHLLPVRDPHRTDSTGLLLQSRAWSQRPWPSAPSGTRSSGSTRSRPPTTSRGCPTRCGSCSRTCS